jgi:hypothetical protein
VEVEPLGLLGREHAHMGEFDDARQSHRMSCMYSRDAVLESTLEVRFVVRWKVEFKGHLFANTKQGGAQG